MAKKAKAPPVQDKAETEAMAREKVCRARARLVWKQDALAVFYASIAMSWRLKADWRVPTAAVDGTHLFYNPDWINSLDDKQCVGLLYHEACHDAFGHHWRRGNREWGPCNVAMDLAINCHLEKQHVTLPTEGCYPGKDMFKDFPPFLAFEAYYKMLYDKNMVKTVCVGGPGSDPGGCGGIGDPQGGEAGLAEAQANNAMKVQQAAHMARTTGRGTLPGDIMALIQEIEAPKVDWKQVLRRWMHDQFKGDYAWVPPSRRWFAQGIHLPGLASDDAGSFGLSVDTSGSCWDENFQKTFCSEVNGVLQAGKVNLHVAYHDTRITRTDDWDTEKGQFILRPEGGGGTDHHCVFDHFRKKRPTALIMLTDGYSAWPAQPPEYPCLWVIVGNPSFKAPYGETVLVEL